MELLHVSPVSRTRLHQPAPSQQPVGEPVFARPVVLAHRLAHSDLVLLPFVHHSVETISIVRLHAADGDSGSHVDTSAPANKALNRITNKPISFRSRFPNITLSCFHARDLFSSLSPTHPPACQDRLPPRSLSDSIHNLDTRMQTLGTYMIVPAALSPI